MEEPLSITSERVDDVPLLLSQLARMEVAALLDAHFPIHGRWTGVSLGGTAVVWLTHILSQADHRLSHVQPWAERRLETLRRGLVAVEQSAQPALRALDVADDRLAAILEALSDDVRWAAFEQTLTGRLLRVYDLATERVRLDTTTASGYWEVTPEGLFQFGHSKDHRPDLPQLKVMLATLDPLGLPVATDVLSGERADDPLYLPAIARVRAAVGRAGLLYVGDCKMAALDTRAGIAAGGDGYLCPLPAGQVPSASLDQWLAAVERGAQPLETVERPRADEQVVPIAEGYEWTERRTATVDGTPVGWPERWLLVRSLAHARAAEAGLRDRLAKAQTALAGLAARAARAARSSRGRPVPGSSLVATHQAAAAIRTQYQVADLLQVTCAEQLATHTVPLGAGRQATVCDPHAPPVVQLTVTVDQAALEATVRRLGWRVYVTNQPVAQLSLAQAVLAYRDEYLVERSLGRLKGQPLSLTPMYLARDDHATGLVRLLAIALRVLTLLEGVVRRQLAQPDEVPLVGLTAGNPTRATRRPTAERLLAAFEDLTLTVLRTPAAVVRHLTPLSPLQHRILTLLGCPPDLYTGLTAAHGAQPP